MDIIINIGVSEGKPCLILEFPSGYSIVLPIQDAQQLAVAMLVSCGAALERYQG